MSLSSVLAAFTTDASAAGLSEESYFTKAIAENNLTVLAAMLAEAISQSDSATESAIQSIINNLSGRKQVAVVEWDFAVDGGTQDLPIDLTSKVINLFPVGSLITHFGMLVLETLTVMDAPTYQVDDGVTLGLFTSLSVSGFSDAGTSQSYPYNPIGNVNGDIRIVESDAGPNNTALSKVVLTFTDGSVTAGKVRFYFEYLTPLG
jgi:hypothetical protein